VVGLSAGMLRGETNLVANAMVEIGAGTIPAMLGFITAVPARKIESLGSAPYRAEIRGRGSVHFFDHAVYGNSLNLIPGILGQQIVRASFALPGFNGGDFSAGDGLANLDFTRPNSSQSMHFAKLDHCPVGEGDAKEDGLGIFEVTVFL
jgi:hypothetical protein